MSIATEISRIQTDRNTIRDKLVELGLASDTDNLTALASAIAEIVNNGAVNTTVTENGTYTIPVGYHNGLGNVTVEVASSGGGYGMSVYPFITTALTEDNQTQTSFNVCMSCDFDSVS